MKTRVYIAKSVSSIVNLHRYPSLLNQIFDDHFEKIRPGDNNKINGLLEVLSSLIDKNNIFKFIKIDDFFNRIIPIIQLKQ